MKGIAQGHQISPQKSLTMAQIAQETSLPIEGTRRSNSFMATSLISAHGLEHMYGHGFLALIPAIYDSLGLVPFQASLFPAVRLLSSGLTSIFGGFLVDMFQERRGPILAISMAMIGLGYLLVATLPVYGLILVALLIASAGSALWHPPALGLLAQRFPQRRGFFISLHRSSGNIGDTVAPLLVGLLLGVVGWRWIVGGGTPILFLLALLIVAFLWRVGVNAPQPAAALGGSGLTLYPSSGGGGASPMPLVVAESRLQIQWRSLKEAMAGGGFWAIVPIFLVSAVRGMGDRTVLWILPLYITRGIEDGGLGQSYVFMGIHIALLTAPGIASGPLFGALSDKVGRKSVIVFLMSTAVILPIFIVLGGSSLVMTVAVVLFGLFHYSVNSLTQAAAIDVVEGKQLEGTFIGLMWGGNAAFGVVSVIVGGLIVEAFSWGAAFYFASALFFVGFLLSLLMSRAGTPQPSPA